MILRRETQVLAPNYSREILLLQSQTVLVHRPIKTPLRATNQLNKISVIQTQITAIKIDLIAMSVDTVVRNLVVRE